MICNKTHEVHREMSTGCEFYVLEIILMNKNNQILIVIQIQTFRLYIQPFQIDPVN